VERQGRPINGWQVAAACLGVFLIALLALLGLGYVTKWEWIGVTDKGEANTLWETQYRTLWDWLDLLIVPAAVAIGVLFLEHAQRERERRVESDRLKAEREMEDLQRKRELAVEDQRAQDAALLAYLDRMGDMLPRLRESSNENAEVLADTRALIRARTLAILEPLDRGRKGAMMRFLSESGLLEKELPTTINLRQADFSRSDLTSLNLINTDLQEVSFIEANLGSADLSGADLRGADLSKAILSRARLGTARLAGADLTGADLSYADLSQATGVFEDQLVAVKYLEGATMPDGQKFEDWLKDKEGRGEDAEKSGPS